MWRIAFTLFLQGLVDMGYSQSAIPRFINYEQIPVIGINGDTLEYPFAGGMNNCQFGSIDLNMDGAKDLVVFDRHGDRILPFINSNITGAISYQFHPEYSGYFPKIDHWIETVDYNKDGKNDLFTYTTGGIKVFRNDSDTSLQFTQVSHPYLMSLQGNTLTNILVTYADFPAIADIDGDGDLDILTFWGLGSFVEFHRNMSQEKYGVPDSLEFVKSSNCWGRFAEGIESNEIQLDTCVNFSDFPLKNSDPKHTGSTFLVGDFSGDGLADVVIGDVDFPGLISLTNGGTLDTAVMISQTTDFPNAQKPVNIVSFPAACMVDVNNDHKDDLLVSPFDPSLIRSESSYSSWLYLNTAAKTNSNANFGFVESNFLQKDMLDFGSGAYPAYIDFNADGLQDLVVGNYGVLDSSWFDPYTGLKCRYVSSLALLKNIGSVNSPSFQLITTDYLGLKSLGLQSLSPNVGDIDEDGDLDLICGNSDGKILLFENTAGQGNPVNFVLKDLAFKQIDGGDFSTPQLFDLDKDGHSDIICGKRNGQISYYHNNGPASDPVFQLISDTLGSVDVTNTSLSYFGYSVPFLYRNPEGVTTLLVGSEFGDVFVYTDIDENLNGKFILRGTLPGVKTGWRSSVALQRLDGDEFPDLFVGNYSGGLNFFKGTSGFPIGISPLNPRSEDKLIIQPNPASDHVRVSGIGKPTGKFLLRIYSEQGRLVYEESAVSLPYKLDVSTFKPGVYLIRAVSEEDLFTAKIVVCR